MAKQQQKTESTALDVDPEAYDRFQKSLKPSSDTFRLASTLYNSGDLVGAEQEAQKALLLASNLSLGTQDDAHHLIGQIRMKQGRYKEALNYLTPAGKNTWQAGLNFDVALCYARLGDTRTARQLYSGQALLKYRTVTLRDLPGTRTPQTLEASILMARGMDNFFRATGEAEAFADFDAALKIIPQNGLAAYYAGKSLAHMNRYTDAGPYFVRAAENGKGKFVEDAKGYAYTYRHNEALKKQALDQAVQTPSKP